VKEEIRRNNSQKQKQNKKQRKNFFDCKRRRKAVLSVRALDFLLPFASNFPSCLAERKPKEDTKQEHTGTTGDEMKILQIGLPTSFRSSTTQPSRVDY
jgi:hypothetical protein